ncbi:hypothetical protein IW148_003920 [Coemansia sp. RSA 1199]|nr:hypothetical protein IW148_003920 [Coemansia sp. RSA 1199]
MNAGNVLRAQVVRHGLLQNAHCAPMTAVSATSAIRRLYVPQLNTNGSASAHPQRGKPLTPQELLDKRHPKSPNEALASIIDGELDYDTDMGAVAVNNVVAEKRAATKTNAAKLAKEATDELANTNAAKYAKDTAGDFAKTKAAKYAKDIADDLAKTKAAKYAKDAAGDLAKTKAGKFAKKTVDDFANKHFS